METLSNPKPQTPKMTFDIQISQGHEPSLPPADAYIVIDVIRAFTTTQVAFDRGAERILLAAQIDDAFALKRANPSAILAGERDALKLEGFDLGNSPAACAEVELDARTLILTTTNGVRATLHALKSAAPHGAPVLVTGFSNALASARFLREKSLAAGSAQKTRVHLIASHPTGDEDLACAEFLRGWLLDDESLDVASVVERIRKSHAAQKFLDPARPKFDPRDIDFCAEARPENFVMLAVAHEAGPQIIARPLTKAPGGICPC